MLQIGQPKFPLRVPFYLIERTSLSSMSSSRAYFSFRPEVSFSLEVLSTSFLFSYVQKYKVGESRLK